MALPETRASLLLRLGDPADAAAWSDFAAIYEPFLKRLAESRGMQPADADDVVQETLIAIANAVADFEPNGRPGAFRSWLVVIARRKLIDHLRHHARRPAAAGGSVAGAMLAEFEGDAAEDLTHTLDFRREVFRWAVGRVRDRVRSATWTAFERTAIGEDAVEAVAVELGIRPAAVYVARCRVIARLRETVGEWVPPESVSLPSANPQVQP